MATNVPTDAPVNIYLGAEGEPVFDDNLGAEAEFGATRGALLNSRGTNPTDIYFPGAIGAPVISD